MLGAIQVLRNADGGGGNIFRKKRYECVRFNVISVTRGWVGVQFPEKKRYVTLEWPLGQIHESLSLLGTGRPIHRIYASRLKDRTQCTI